MQRLALWTMFWVMSSGFLSSRVQRGCVDASIRVGFPKPPYKKPCSLHPFTNSKLGAVSVLGRGPTSVGIGHDPWKLILTWDFERRRYCQLYMLMKILVTGQILVLIALGVLCRRNYEQFFSVVNWDGTQVGMIWKSSVYFQALGLSVLPL